MSVFDELGQYDPSLMNLLYSMYSKGFLYDSIMGTGWKNYDGEFHPNKQLGQALVLRRKLSEFSESNIITICNRLYSSTYSNKIKIGVIKEGPDKGKTAFMFPWN